MDNFRTFSVTHKGAKHGDEECCQDASIHISFENVAIAVVADGHGSSRCFRSDIGSKAAVDATENTLKSYMKNLSEAVIDPEDFKIELHKIVKQIINRWFATVMKDEEANPIIEDPKLERIAEKYKERYINNPDYRSHAYGTTLMIAVHCENYWFGFQVGDGKCVVLYEDGLWKMPIPWDDRCSFNLTTSICDDDSLSSFRYWFGIKESDGSYTEYVYGVDGQGRDLPVPLKTISRPLAIFVASDGVEDSYPSVNNDKYIINFYRNRIIELTDNGFDSFKEQIDNFAKRFADRESTDDVSIACILGDFSNRTEMVINMKRESELHEATEMAAIRRRDADEKRDALNAVENRTNDATSSQNQFKIKRVALEQEILDLETKKSSYESALTKGESEVAKSDNELLNIKDTIGKLKNEHSYLLKNEKNYSSDLLIADSNAKGAYREWEKSKNSISTKNAALEKADEKHKNYLSKMAAMNHAPKSECDSTNDTTDSSQKYPHQQYNQVQQPQTSNEGVEFIDGVIKVFVKDSEKLERNIEQATKELNVALSYESTARLLYEQRSEELTSLQQKLKSLREKIQQVNYDLSHAEQNYKNEVMQNQNQRAAVALCRNSITDIMKQIKSKQMEIDKLQVKLEALGEQTKKQIFVLNEIREAWEKAEAEAKIYEEIVQQQ